MSNLTDGGGQPAQRLVNTAYVHSGASLGEESSRKVAPTGGLAAYQLVGGVMAHQGDDG